MEDHTLRIVAVNSEGVTAELTCHGHPEDGCDVRAGWEQSQIVSPRMRIMLGNELPSSKSPARPEIVRRAAPGADVVDVTGWDQKFTVSTAAERWPKYADNDDLIVLPPGAFGDVFGGFVDREDAERFAHEATFRLWWGVLVSPDGPMYVAEAVDEYRGKTLLCRCDSVYCYAEIIADLIAETAPQR